MVVTALQNASPPIDQIDQNRHQQSYSESRKHMVPYVFQDVFPVFSHRIT